MNQKELIDTIANDLCMTKASVRRVFKHAGALAAESVNNGGSFQLPGIGSIRRGMRPAMRRWIPARNEVRVVPATAVIRFRASKSIKEKIAF